MLILGSVVINDMFQRNPDGYALTVERVFDYVSPSLLYGIAFSKCIYSLFYRVNYDTDYDLDYLSGAFTHAPLVAPVDTLSVLYLHYVSTH